MSTHSRTPHRQRAINGLVPFRRADALEVGMSVRELTGPRFQRIFHGVYLSSKLQITPPVRARAALITSTSTAYASHHTAAQLWGGVPPHDPGTHISVPADESRSERHGISAHVAVPSPRVRERHGVRVSSPAQCFCELAATGTGLVDLVVLGDSLVKAKSATIDDLVDAAADWKHRGAKIARRAAHLVREGVDSPMESRLRMLIVLAGLPEPEVNVIMRHDNGEWRRRFELCYRDLKLLIEYDGEHHVVDPRQRARDLERREELERSGWRFIVIQKEHIYRQPAQVLARIQQARLDCGASRASCRIRSTWRQYFDQ